MTQFCLLIDGRMVQGDHHLDVINPATETIIARCSRASLAQLDDAVAAAKRAYPNWSNQSLSGRRKAIVAIADVILENVNELAVLLTSEQGKPIADAKREVTGMAAFFRALSSFEYTADVLESSDVRHVEVKRVPLGVVAAIIPWNFPLLTIGFKLPPALLAGNTVVLKPSPTTPLSTLRFAELVAGILPKGVLNVIVDADDLGNAITSHADIRKVSFTGSTDTGQKVMASASPSLKRLTLELGGNDAAIVLDDVNPEAIAPSIFRAAFFNAGQVCLAIKRLYVHEKVHDALCAALVKEADRWPIGDGSDAGSRIGPLQNKKQFEKVKKLLDSANASGRIILGGEVPKGPGYFVTPTIVTELPHASPLVDEEQFGPILPVVKFSDVDSAIEAANSTPFGLGASVWSSDAARSQDVANRLEAGTVWINKHAELLPTIPFGGAKQSGIGVEFAREGLLEFTQLKIINAAR